MPTISNSTIQDIISELPDWTPFVAPEDVSLFVGTIGFEERSPHCFKSWASATKVPNSRALMVEYTTNVEDNEKRRREFVKYANKWNIQMDFVEYARPALFGEVERALRDIDSEEIVLLDISSVSSYVFFPLAQALCNALPQSCLRICYAEASKYYPTQREWNDLLKKTRAKDTLERARLLDESNFHSRGVDFVYESSVFPGANPDNLPVRIICVPNFSFERVNQMRSYLNRRYSIAPNSYDWIFGVPPDETKNGWRTTALQELYRLEDEAVRVASTLKYKDILLTLHRIWKENVYTNTLMVSTVGSKPQHLGTLLFLNMHREVGLVLSEPVRFSASRYSEGVGNVWQVQFGKIEHLLESLRNWNRINFDW